MIRKSVKRFSDKIMLKQKTFPWAIRARAAGTGSDRETGLT
jgi:hypothetical protein